MGLISSIYGKHRRRVWGRKKRTKRFGPLSRTISQKLADSRKHDYADKLRQGMTSAEKSLWFHLSRLKGWKAQRVICGYIPDFVHEDRKLIVEVDGGIHTIPAVAANDRIRQSRLEAMGYRVIRFTNIQVKDTIQKVLHDIRIAVR